MRKLTSIEKVIDIRPIENADNIEVATVKGWDIVVKKNEFKVGEEAVYLEVDSWVPNTLAPFLCKSDTPKVYMGIKGERLKTIKLRGQISQGLLLPVNTLVEKGYNLQSENLDEELGVIKYEHVTTNTNNAKGNFPSFIAKTDEERVQNIYYENYLNQSFVLSEKLDGCLHYDMNITTDQGQIPIGSIVNKKLNVNVLCYNENNKKLEYKPIEHYHKYKLDKKVLKLGIRQKGKGNRTKYVKCTDNHHFLTDKGWIEAKHLQVGSVVYQKSKKVRYEVQQMILGCLLGDSSVCKDSHLVTFNHCEAQSEYFAYKSKLLGDMFSEQKPTKGGFVGSTYQRRGILRANQGLKELIETVCLVDNKKTLSQDWVDTLSPIALAFWYMDDGSISNRDEVKQQPRASFATNGFSYEEVLLLQDTLFRRYNIKSTIGLKPSYKGCTLTLNTESSEKFFSLIAPYVCESMKYKLPMIYEDLPCIFDNSTWDTTLSLIETDILSVEDISAQVKDDGYLSNVYDLTVKDNHNYFAQNILVHNSSMTVYWRDGEFGVCSRNIDLKEDVGSKFWHVANMYNLREKLNELQLNIALQGELIGDGIQKNRYGINGNDFYVFTVFNINKFEKMSYSDMSELCHLLNVKTVPILDVDFQLPKERSKLIELADGFSKLNPKTIREGFVCRTSDSQTSFKVISNKFLLKHQ